MKKKSYATLKLFYSTLQVATIAIKKSERSLRKLWSKHKYVDFFFSGRVAINFSVKHIGSKQNSQKSILLPEVLLPLLKPIVNNNDYSILTYPQINTSLSEIINQIEKYKPTIFYVATLFGSSQLQEELINNEKLRDVIKTTETVILYDFCHDFSIINQYCDSQDLPYIAIGSFNNKLIPGLMGAVLCSNCVDKKARSRTSISERIKLLGLVIRKEHYFKLKKEVTFEQDSKFLFDLRHEKATSIQLNYACYLINKRLPSIIIQRKSNTIQKENEIVLFKHVSTSPFHLIRIDESSALGKNKGSLNESRHIYENNSLENLYFTKNSWKSSIITFSSYTNAWSLNKGVKKLGLKLNSNSNSSIRFIKTTSIKINKGDFLVFTDEDKLKMYYNRSKDLCFFPKGLPFELIDDKLLFAETLSKMNEHPVNHYDSVENANFPAYLKFRSSWVNGKRLAKGYVVNSFREYQVVIARITATGVDASDLFLQKLMTESISSNLSVSGFYDTEKPETSISIVTSKLMSARGNQFGTGSLISTINDPQNLRDRTYSILNNLNYHGPFELEFYYDSDDGIYKVLELNPRFWMQHGLFEKFLQNALLKKYFGLEFGNYITDKESINLKAIWVDGSDLYEKLLSVEFIKTITKLLSYSAKGYSIYIGPSFSSWFSAVMNYKINNILNKNES